MEQMTADIGSRLRQAREHRGFTLRDIAATTKISMTALVAMERNDFDRLPGGVFRRGYLRAFAAQVGLDADELVREYRTRFETEPPAAPLAPNEADWKNRLRLAQRVPAVLVAIVGVVIGGSVLLERAQVLHEGSEGPDAPGAVEVDIPVGTAQPDDSDSTAEVAFATSAVTDIRAPSLRLEIWTTGLCWISAMADGERAVYRLMYPGERALVEARTGIVLRVGDAGAFRYSINGAAGRSLGRSGEAVTIRLTNDNLESLYAKPASSFPAGGAHDSTGRRDLEQQWSTGERHGSSLEVQARRVFAESGQAHPSQRARQLLQTGFDEYTEGRNRKGAAVLLQEPDGRAAILMVVGDQGGSACRPTTSQRSRPSEGDLVFLRVLQDPYEDDREPRLVRVSSKSKHPSVGHASDAEQSGPASTIVCTSLKPRSAEDRSTPGPLHETGAPDSKTRKRHQWH